MNEKRNFIIKIRENKVSPRGPSGRWEYDYSAFLDIFTHEQLGLICDELSRLYLEEVLDPKTFRDNYLTPSHDILTDLMCWYSQNSWTSLSQQCWKQYVEYKERRILQQKKAENTQKKWLMLLNLFLTILYRIEILTSPIEVRRIKKSEHKREAGRGSKLKKIRNKEDKYIGPFAFRLEGHVRPYDFRKYVVLGELFLTEIVKVFKLFIRDTNGREYSAAIRLFLDYLVFKREQGNNNDFFDLLAGEGFLLIDSLIWEKMVYEWRNQFIEHVRRNDQSLDAANKKLIALGRFWSFMAERKLLPHLSIVGIKNARKRSSSIRGRRQSLIELSPHHSKPKAIAEKSLVDKIEKALPPEERSDALRCIKALATSLEPNQLQEASSEQLMDLLLQLNTDRLGDIRDMAEMEFSHWFEHWLIGQQAMELAKQRFSPGELGNCSIVTHFLFGRERKILPNFSSNPKRPNVWVIFYCMFLSSMMG